MHLKNYFVPHKNIFCMHYKSEPVNVFRKIIILYCVDVKKSNTPIECKTPSPGANALGKYSDCGSTIHF